MIRMLSRKIPFCIGSVREQTLRAGEYAICLAKSVYFIDYPCLQHRDITTQLLFHFAFNCSKLHIFPDVSILWCRQSFVKALEPFVKWLEEAEEED